MTELDQERLAVVRRVLLARVHVHDLQQSRAIALRIAARGGQPITEGEAPS